jgi:hypothetical protein
MNPNLRMPNQVTRLFSILMKTSFLVSLCILGPHEERTLLAIPAAAASKEFLGLFAVHVKSLK